MCFGGTMPCEMCGKRGPTVLAELEGSELRVCYDCAKLGTIITREKKKQQARVSMEAALQFRQKRRTQRDVLKGVDEWELIPDYGKAIVRARQKLKLTQKELAEKLNERKSTIAKLEAEEFYPDKKLITKLENFLHLKLREAVSAAPVHHASPGGGMTLGDLIRMQKK